MFRISTATISVGFCAVIALGCQVPQQPVDSPIAVPPSSMLITGADQVRRVIIIPFENRTRFVGIQRPIQNQLAASIRQSGIFEVVDVSMPLNRPCDLQSITRGEYPLGLLVDALHRFNADAVLFGGIHEYHPYDPLSLGMTLHLVDTREAAGLAAFDGHWTTADVKTRLAFQQFLEQRYARQVAPDFLLNSPSAFTAFVIAQIIRQMTDH